MMCCVMCDVMWLWLDNFSPLSTPPHLTSTNSCHSKALNAGVNILGEYFVDWKDIHPRTKIPVPPQSIIVSPIHLSTFEICDPLWIFNSWTPLVVVEPWAPAWKKAWMILFGNRSKKSILVHSFWLRCSIHAMLCLIRLQNLHLNSQRTAWRKSEQKLHERSCKLQ